MFLSLQTGSSLVKAAVACSIPERTSGFETSSETTVPRYMELDTVPSFCLGAISAVFHQFGRPSALISILYLVRLLSRLSPSSCSSSARALMLSTNRRLVIFLPPMVAHKAACHTRSKAFLKSTKTDFVDVRGTFHTGF